MFVYAKTFRSASSLGLVHWDDPEGWNGEGGGRRVQDGEHMYAESKIEDLAMNVSPKKGMCH